MKWRIFGEVVTDNHLETSSCPPSWPASLPASEITSTNSSSLLRLLKIFFVVINKIKSKLIATRLSTFRIELCLDLPNGEHFTCCWDPSLMKKHFSSKHDNDISIDRKWYNLKWWVMIFYNFFRRIYLQTPSPVHNPHKIAEETRRNMTPEKKYKLNNWIW